MLSVIAASACPNICCTTFTSAPAAIASDAAVWRNLCGVRPGTSNLAAATAALNSRARQLFARNDWPRAVVKTSSSLARVPMESVAYRIWQDADQFAYVIADQKLVRQDIARAVLTDREPESADTLEALAERLDIDPSALVATVEKYNAAAQPGPLDVTRLDGVSTSGLEPPKSNWARPIDEPPYVAWPVTCAITFTFGGLKTDEHALGQTRGA
jgi:hypothetical protein